jgi:hypothetical protein
MANLIATPMTKAQAGAFTLPQLASALASDSFAAWATLATS